MNLFELSAVLSLNSKGFESGLQNSESLMGRIGGSIKNGFSKLGNVAQAAMAKAGDAALGLVKDSINAGANFDAGMSNVAAISGATGKELDKLRAKAMEMGAKTKFSASEAADAFSYMAMAGWKTSDMLSGIEGIMNLAAASGEDLALTSDIVTDALTAFGLKASDSAHFADIMAAASSNANTNVALMGETFKYVAPVAGALGSSAEDTAEAIGLLANAGIKGSQAGTSLRSILTRLATDAGASTKSLGALGILTKELGVQFYKSDGSVRDFSDIIDDARKAWKKLSKEDAATFAKKIAGQEGISAWLAMMEAAPEDLEKLRKSIEDCDGAAENMANTMNDNLKGDVTIFKSALESLQIVISDKLSPALRKFVQFGTTALGKLKDAFTSGGFKKAVSVFGDILSEIWWKFKDYLPKLASAGWDLVKWAVKGVFNGIKKIKLPTWKDVKKFAVDAWNTIKKGVADLGGIIFGKNKKGKVKWPTWKDVKQTAKDAWNKITEAAKTLGNEFGELLFGKDEKGKVKWPTWEDVKQAAKDAWDKIVAAAKSLGNEFGALVFGKNEKGEVKWPTWDGEDGVKAKAEAAWKTITDEAGKLPGKVFGFWPDGSVAWPKWEDTTDENGVLHKGVKTLAEEAWQTIVDGAKTLKGLIFGDAADAGSVFDGIKESWNTLKTTIESGVIDVSKYFFGDEKGAEVAKTVNDFGKALEVVGAAILGAGFAKTFESVVKTVRSLFTGGTGMSKTELIFSAIAAVTTLVIQNWDKIEPVLQTVGSFVDQYLIKPIESVIDWFKEAIQTVGEFFGLDVFGGVRKRQGEKLFTQIMEQNFGTKEELRDYIEKNFNGALSDSSLDLLWSSMGREKNGWGNINREKTLENVFDAIGDLSEKTQSAGDDLSAAFNDANASAATAKDSIDAVREAAENASGTYPISFPVTTDSGSFEDGSHAKGAWNIPYDNYSAVLHRGEMVLTSSQARRYRDGDGGSMNLSALTSAVVNAVREGMAGAVVRSYLNGKDVTDDVARRMGNAMKSQRYAT
jgi:TP901 family phage tail tape measure protein